MLESFTLQDIFNKAGESIDVVYLIDKEQDRFEARKNTPLFREAFGDTGKYSELMRGFHENSVDRRVSRNTPYGVFSDSANYTEVITRSAHMYLGEKEVFIAIETAPMDETHIALFIRNVSEQDYIKSQFESTEKKVLESAYLFTMDVDLNADKIGAMSMSEINDSPASFPDLKYSEWRSMIVNMFLPEDKEKFLLITDKDYLKANLTFMRSQSTDIQMMNLDGVYIWVKLIFHRIKTGRDEDFRFFFMVEDIHESHKRLIADMNHFEEMAKHDQLTGILNRVGIQAEIADRSDKYAEEGRPITLLLFDIDHFKQVNDTYGHSTGDEILKKLAAIAREVLESHEGLLGRWGGEEFLGMLQGKSMDETAQIAEELRAAIAEHDFGEVGPVTISIGIMRKAPDQSDQETFDQLDHVLYRAKNNGRNRVERG